MCFRDTTIRSGVHQVVVPRSYLIKVKEHEYSVPYTYIKESVDVFINNDTIVVKFKGKEIARLLREDKPGRTCDPAHMPPEHKSIALNNELMGTQEKIIQMASKFSPELLRFCNAKFMATESEHVNKANAIKTSQGVISFYVKNSNKSLVNLSLLESLKCPSKMWNPPCLKSIFLNKCNEYFENHKKPQQAPAQIVRATSEQAHLRDYKGADAIKGSFSSNSSFSTTSTTQSDEDLLN
uniref:Mu transposase domain-containing protein n=1 Tax=Succinivibrio sp. TaxID=2053619 RepID=UPI00402ADDD8